MPTSLNARFDADFSQLQKAVDGADVHLQTFEKAANRASVEVGKLASSFRGDALIRDATLAVRAVESIGGATKLTIADQQKLLTTTTQAIDALKRQGSEVPPGLAKISAELKNINDAGHVDKAIGGLQGLGSSAGPAGTAVEGLSNKFTSLGSTASALGPLGIALAGVTAGAVGLVAIGVQVVSTLTGLVTHTANAGDEMLTLSNKTKVSVDALGEFKYIGDQTGTTVEAITDSVFKMSQNIGDGSKKTQLAVKDLGLSFTQLRAEAPEQAFKDVIAALAQVPDPARQAADGVAIFGKGFKEVSQLTQEDMPALIARFHDLGGGVTTEMGIAGDAVNDALSDIGTAFESVKLKIGAAFLPTVASVLQQFTDAWIQASKQAGLSYIEFAQTVEKVTAIILRFIGDAIGALGGFLASLEGVGSRIQGLGKAMQATIPDFGQSGATMIEAGKKLSAFGDSAKGVSDVALHLGYTLGTTTAESLAKLRLEIERKSWKEWGPTLAELGGKSGELADAANATKDKIKSLGDQMAKTVEEARKTAIEFDTGKLSLTSLGSKQAEVNKLFLDAATALQAMGKTSDPLYDKFTKIAFATANWQTSLGPLKTGIDDVIKALDKLPDVSAKTDIIIGGYAKLALTVDQVGQSLKGLGSPIANADRAFTTSLRGLNDAFHAFGITSRQELIQVAATARENFEKLQASGLATTHELQIAYDQMIDAQIRATGKLPPLWREIGPQIKGVLFDVRDSFNEAVAGMLLHITSLKDGWAAIWDSMKQSALRILEDILAYYEKVFIAKLIANLTGVNIPIGGGGGGGGGIGSAVAGTAVQQGENAAGKWALNALGVGGGAATTGGLVAGGTSIASADTAFAASGLAASGTSGGAGAAAGGGTFGGLATSAALGGAAAGGAGLGLGLLGTKIFGGSGWKASGFGAAAGAGAGALIGTFVFPGIGTAVGAGIGALAGAIGGWIGKSVGEKVNDARDEFVKQFGETGTGKGSGFQTLAEEAQKLTSIGLDGQKMFENLFKADNWDDLNAAVKAWTDALESVPYATLKVKDSFDALQNQQQQLIASGLEQSDALKMQAGDYSVLFDTIVKSGAAVPAGLEPILQSLIDMGLLVDENGQKVLNLDTLIKKTSEGSSDGLGTINAALSDLIKGLDDTTKRAIYNSEAWQDVLFNGKKIGPEIKASLLQAAAAAGLTQEQLDSIATILGDITDAADQAADALEHMPRSVDIDVRYRRDYYDDGYAPPPTATGGIVTRPQVRLVGEAGPEAIIPLNRMPSSAPTEQRIIVQLDRRTLLDALVQGMPAYLDLKGATR